MNEKISIIVPVYNSKKYLKKCVTSILNQSYENIEVILVDDESTDGSGMICDEFQKANSRVRVIHKKNGGPSECRNIGLKEATGCYIGFVDSDDYIDEHMYEILYKSIKDNNADIAQIGHYIVKNDEIIETIHGNQEIVYLKENEIVKAIVEDKIINNFTLDKLYKKQLFEGFEFINLSYHEDLASMSLLLSKSKKYVCNNIPLYYYVRNEQSISHTLTPRKYYDSYRAYKLREQIIRKCCPEMLEKNAIHKFEMGICALNTMLRGQEAGRKYEKEIEHLMDEMKCDRNQIIGNRKISSNIKIYLKLLSCKRLYKFFCLLDLHKNGR